MSRASGTYGRRGRLNDAVTGARHPATTLWQSEVGNLQLKGEWAPERRVGRRAARLPSAYD